MHGAALSSSPSSLLPKKEEMMQAHLSGSSAPEKLVNIQTAAKALGVHPWALRRAINAGTIPAYTPFNSRKLVKLSEVVAYINSCRQGGAE
jgi:hypothetical protein